ncbi:polysaccharide deacetylase family protein [uncultured Slackia sp.]|uniref:polysaccharide deacetylase family protein n=1 Tax=uncultured Slackia sp. TaxID=665903 RepID=UPI0026251237|nr:polysaccharide deacetylase family protein [uncultured Slackia sp.]
MNSNLGLKAACSILQRVYRRKYECGTSLARVYMVHSVVKDGDLPPNSIYQSSFIEWIEEKQRAGEKFVAIDEIGSESNCAILTFDDVYSSVMENAIPYLREKQIPYVCFITTNYLDRDGYISQTQLLELKDDSLCVIGSHTENHPLLRFCDNETAHNEIVRSKSVLEQIIGSSVSYFAYPYGSIYACSKRDRKFARDAGYDLCFSTINASLSQLALNEKDFVPRLSVEEETWRFV